MPNPGEPLTLAEAASLIGARLEGGGDAVVRGVAPIEDADSDQVTFLTNMHYRASLGKSAAAAVIIGEHDADLSMPQLVAEVPYAAYARLMHHFYMPERVAAGISPDARLAEAVKVGAEPDIGAFVTVGRDTVVGDRVTLHPGVRIGAGCVIGDDVVLHANVVVEERCRIGDRVRIHAGSVIGSDGFGYATEDGVHHKIPHTGSVVVEDDVEIGANVTVDRGVLGDTVIGAGSKLDNQVHLAHNVRIGRGCLLTGQTGVSGSSTLGDYVVMGGQAGVAGHLKLGNQVRVAARGGVTRDIPDGAVVSGFPARPHREELKAQAAVSRLPELRERVRRLEKNQK